MCYLLALFAVFECSASNCIFQVFIATVCNYCFFLVLIFLQSFDDAFLSIFEISQYFLKIALRLAKVRFYFTRSGIVLVGSFVFVLFLSGFTFFLFFF